MQDIRVGKLVINCCVGGSGMYYSSVNDSMYRKIYKNKYNKNNFIIENKLYVKYESQVIN